MAITVLCGHWGICLDCNVINAFLAGILSPFSDRRHRIYLCGAVIFSSLLLSFNLIINGDDVMFRSDNDGFICWRLLSPINLNSSSWVSPRVLQVNCMS